MEEERNQLGEAIDGLVRILEMFQPTSFFGEAADLEKLGLTEKVSEVKSKWLEHASDILIEVRGLRARSREPALAKKLDEAINQIEEMRRHLL